MDESEKMVALKRAYAEIILNTAKEAAARVMASERRALRCQHDLNAAKDEALQLLIRLKKMIDAKDTEVEINAINQRRRIEELEAQLQEAEDKIIDLRMELRNVSDEVEKKKNETQIFSGVNAKEEAVDPKDEIPENHSNSLEPIVPYSSDSELETVAASVINGAFSRRIQDHNFSDATKQTGQAAVSSLQNYFRHSSLASILMRNAEPELCRNGCTQRIRAFERNHPGVTLATGEVVSGCISAMDVPKSKASENNGNNSTQKFPRASCLATRKKLRQEEIKKPKMHTRQRRKSQFVRSKSSSRRSYSSQFLRCSQSSSLVADCNLANSNNKCGEAVPAEVSSMDAKQDRQQDSVGLQEKLHDDISPFTAGKVLKGKRKRKVVRRKSLETSLKSVAGCCGTNLVDASAKRNKVWVDVSKEEAEMGSLQCLDPLLLLIKSTEDSAAGVVDVPSIVKEEKLSNEHQLVEQEKDALEVRGITISGLDREEIDGGFGNSDSKDADIAHDSKGPTKDSRVLKYTFHRKRKKDSSNCPDDGASPEKNNIKKLANDMEDAAQGSKRSNLMNESSRDSRRLAQVARQLISLSGKRW